MPGLWSILPRTRIASTMTHILSGMEFGGGILEGGGGRRGGGGRDFIGGFVLSITERVLDGTAGTVPDGTRERLGLSSTIDEMVDSIDRPLDECGPTPNVAVESRKTEDGAGTRIGTGGVNWNC